MNFEQVRRLTIAALFSDDKLFDQLVLKGGNAMSLIHRISPRLSLDLDFSLEFDFENIEDTRKRMEDALGSRFESVKLVPFDVQLEPKPSVGRADRPWWGGYELKFKLIDDRRYRSYGSDRRRMQREALVLGTGQQRVFTVDFSKHEYTAKKVRAELDHYTIYVYSPAMIAVEKIRAICQQMAEYEPTGGTKRARARDFFDIHAVVTKTCFSFGSPESLEMVPLIFAAKEVPLPLIGQISEQREFHRLDWPSVVATVNEGIGEFDFYFNFVLQEIEPLHSLWNK